MYARDLRNLEHHSWIKKKLQNMFQNNSFYNHNKSCSKHSLVETREEWNSSFFHNESLLIIESIVLSWNKPQFNCIFDCLKSFVRFNSLEKHLMIDHEVECIKYLSIDSIDLFQSWLEFEGMSTSTY